MTAVDVQGSPYLNGAMEPVFDERDDVRLRVSGELAAGLQGTFLRNGPNPQFAPTGVYHPFDGDGMLHAVTFDDGDVRYRNRWIVSRGLSAERERGMALFGGMVQFKLPEPDVIAVAGVIKNTGNTHTIRHAGRTFAMLEACLPTQIADDLSTVGECDFGGKLSGPFTAHPKVDPYSGEMISFGYSPFPPYLRYYVVSPDGELVHNVGIDLDVPVMVHDFVVTEHFTIFFDSPAVFQTSALSRGEPLVRWEPERGTRIGVMPRFGDGGSIRWFDVDNQYVVHFFNAWEDGSTVHIAAPRTNSMPDALATADPLGAEGPLPWRWSIDLDRGAVTDAQIDDVEGEFPRVNDLRATRPTRYLYNNPAETWGMSFDFNGVVKYDLETGLSTRHRYSPNEIAGEHVFAPNPDGVDEDDGWLLSMVIDRATRETDLVVLDAKNVAADPIARVHMPRRVPIGFHVSWLAAEH